MEGSVIKKVVTALMVMSVPGLLGLFIDVQVSKAQIRRNAEQIGASHKNNKLICLLALKITKLKKEDVEKFCVQ